MSDNGKVCYWVVDSVKGGCGKTMNSLYLACHNAMKKGNRTLYIDMDLLGTSTEASLFYNGSHNEVHVGDDITTPDISEVNILTNNGHRKLARKYLNSIINNTPLLSELTTELYIRVSNKNKGRVDDSSVDSSGDSLYSFDAILSSPYLEDKAYFRENSPNAAVHFSYFRKRLYTLLLAAREEYAHIILDMPPNSDSYSDCVYDLLLRDNLPNPPFGNPLVGKSGRVTIVHVTTGDVAHVKSTIEVLISELRAHNDSHMRRPHESLVIINNLDQNSQRLDGFANEIILNEYYEAIKYEIVYELDNANLNHDNIKFLRSEYNRQYAYSSRYFYGWPDGTDGKSGIPISTSTLYDFFWDDISLKTFDPSNIIKG